MNKIITILGILTLILLVACTNKEKQLEEDSIKFAKLFSNGNYNDLYLMLSTDIKKVNKAEFEIAMLDAGFFDELIIYEKSIVNNDKKTGNVFYSLTIGGQNVKMRPIEVIYSKEDKSWKFYAFSNVVEESCRLKGGECKTTCDLNQKESWQIDKGFLHCPYQYDKKYRMNCCF